MTVRRASLQNLSVMRRIHIQPCYDLGEGLLFQVDHALLYIAFSGDDIRVDVDDENLVQALNWVAGKGMVVSSLFTGYLPLHAAGAVFDKQFFGLLAPSGTGKSTTVRALMDAGALFANDDTIPIRFEDATPIAYPSVSLYPKLHRTLLELEGLDASHYQAVLPDQDKFWVPIPTEARTIKPQRLSALFLLQPAEIETHKVLVIQNSVESAAQTIYQNLQGIWFVQKYISHDRLLPLCQSLAQSVPVYTLRYRKTFEVLPRLVDAIHAAL